MCRSVFLKTGEHDHCYSGLSYTENDGGDAVMSAPINISVIFAVILLMLPNYTPGVFTATMAAVICVAFFLPGTFSTKLIRSAASFFELNHSVGKKFITFHAIVFLSVAQIFALLWSIDYLFSQFLGEGHSLYMMAVIVTAGLIAVVGDLAMIRIMEFGAAMSLVSGLAVVLVNRFILHYPLVTLLNSALFASREVDGMVNVILTIGALSMIIFWMMWLEPSELGRKIESGKDAFVSRSVIGSGIFLAVVFLFFTPALSATRDGIEAGSNSVNVLIGVCSVGGLIGLFVTTFSSVGSLFAFRHYPLFNKNAGPEKRMLANKLATVFSVILSILLIPVVRNAGGTVIIGYLYFMAAFSSPIVAAFFVSQTFRKHHPLLLSVSIVLGEMFALTECITRMIFGTGLFVNAENIFVLTIAGAAVTIASYGAGGFALEMVVVQKVMSRTKAS